METSATDNTQSIFSNDEMSESLGYTMTEPKEVAVDVDSGYVNCDSDTFNNDEAFKDNETLIDHLRETVEVSRQSVTHDSLDVMRIREVEAVFIQQRVNGGLAIQELDVKTKNEMLDVIGWFLFGNEWTLDSGEVGQAEAIEEVIEDAKG